MFDGRSVPSRRALYPVVLPLIVVLMLAALKLDDALHPPLWVHALIWPPVVTVVILGAVRLVQRANPPRNGEGDHAQHGGGASPHSTDLSNEAPSRKTPPPPCAQGAQFTLSSSASSSRRGRSPSPKREGSA